MAKPTRDRLERNRLVNLVREPSELSQRVRLRIALDVLKSVLARAARPTGARSRGTSEAAIPVVARQANALTLANVIVDDSGVSRVDSGGVTAGAAELVWEVLAGRAAPVGLMPPLRDVVDEVPTDVDEIVCRALEFDGKMTLDELATLLEEKGGAYVGTHHDVRSAVRPGSLGHASLPPDIRAVFDVSGVDLDADEEETLLQQGVARSVPVASSKPRTPPEPQATCPPERRELVAFCDGGVYPITKERFIIGRRKLTTDLTIQDPNVSRVHAVVELVASRHYIADLNSSNGIEHLGRRIERQVIEDGDVFTVGGHEIRFSYR